MEPESRCPSQKPWLKGGSNGTELWPAGKRDHLAPGLAPTQSSWPCTDLGSTKKILLHVSTYRVLSFHSDGLFISPPSPHLRTPAHLSFSLPFTQIIGTLEEIHMPQNGINHPGVTALAQAFAGNSLLRVINLNDNTFTEKGAVAMAEVSLTAGRLLLGLPWGGGISCDVVAPALVRSVGV